MRRKIELSIGEHYHIYNRGTDKRIIFNDTHDYKRFTALLYVCNGFESVNIASHFQKGRSFSELFAVERGEQLVDIIAYCLMPNHFHLLIREKTEGGTSVFMQKLLTGYSMYFNSKNTRTGTLFESRFKSKHTDTDDYLKYLFAYIHLNPIKIIDPEWKDNGVRDMSRAEEFLNDYMFSSYPDWKGNTRLETKIVNKNVSPEYFNTTKDFNEYIGECMNYLNGQ